MKKERRNKEPIEAEGYDSKGVKRKMYLFPKDSTTDEISWKIIDIIWKTRKEIALRENKPLVQVVSEERIRIAKTNNEKIDIERVLDNEMKQYQSLLEYKSSKESTN